MAAPLRPVRKRTFSLRRRRRRRHFGPKMALFDVFWCLRRPFRRRLRTFVRRSAATDDAESAFWGLFGDGGGRFERVFGRFRAVGAPISEALLPDR